MPTGSDPSFMIKRSRALGALVVSTALLVTGCSSAASGSSSTTTTPTSAAPSSAAPTFATTTEATTAAPVPDAERWFPKDHLAAAAGWTGVPSGLVYDNGTYHAFYQHNPTGDGPSGAIDWAHATSTDLVTWTEQPVAIAGTADDQVLTGSIVVDTANTSGLGTADQPPLVAIYTSVGTGQQGQSLAYSLDKGQTWEKYEDNPVLLPDDPSEKLRDPKVFWYEPGGYWVMVGAVTDAFKVQLFKSKNLTDWTSLSEVSSVGAQAGLWESPDLFPLALDGDPANIKWVLLVSTNSGAAAGGSGVQYFVGSFNGTTFTPEPLGPAGVGAIQPGEMHSWADWGSDFFGATTFDSAPDGRRIALAWMNNWHYAEAVPTSPWRGAATLPRELSLATVDGVPRLLQTVPGEASTALAAAGPSFAEDAVTITNGNRKLDAEGTALDISLTLIPGEAAVSGVTVLGNATGQRGTRIQYVQETGILQLDRTASGNTGFSGAFSGGAAATVALTDGKLQLRIVVDGSSVEIFAGDGKAVISSLVFPQEGDNKVGLFAGGGKASAENISVTQL